jgi:formylmethanofuran dehydrogenase subunit B
MSQAVITFNVRASDADLHLQVLLDGQETHSFEATSRDYLVRVELNDDVEIEHCLSMIMSGKRSDHTKIDEQGYILEDRMIEITDVRIDDIELGYVFTQVAVYTHDRNGTAEETTDTFYGTMGCNGQVDFRFNTPVYLWLLENM